MFTFSLADIRAVLARGRSDAAANGGFRVPYQGISPQRQATAGLWVVGDEGVYAMSNGKLADGQRPARCPCRGVRSEDQPGLLALQAQHFGGDDGVEFIDATELETLFAASPGATHLNIVMDDSSMSLTLIRR